MKLLDKIKSDPRVENIWNEGPSWDDGQGWWVSLRDGFNFMDALPFTNEP